MQSANIQKGIVKFATGILVDSKYSDKKRLSIVIEIDGKEQTIWGYEGSEVAQYRRGDTCEFSKNGNKYIFFNVPKNGQPHSVSDSMPQNRQNTEGGYVQKSKTEKFADAALWANENARFYACIFDNVVKAMKDHEIRDDQLISVTTSLYIASKKEVSF